MGEGGNTGNPGDVGLVKIKGHLSSSRSVKSLPVGENVTVMLGDGGGGGASTSSSTPSSSLESVSAVLEPSSKDEGACGICWPSLPEFCLAKSSR